MSAGAIYGNPEAVIPGLPKLIPGKIGNAVSLNGTTLNYEKHPTLCIYNVTLCASGLSVALWVKFYETEEITMMILDSGGFYEIGSGLSFFRKPSNNVMTVSIRDDTHLYKTWTRFASALEWHHITFTWKAWGHIELYINGCPAGRNPKMNPRTSAVTFLSDFRIGGNEWGGPSQRGAFALDHMLVWYALLTPEEVWQFYVQGGQIWKPWPAYASHRNQPIYWCTQWFK